MNYSLNLSTLMLVIYKYWDRMQRNATATSRSQQRGTHSSVQPFKMANIYDFDHENVAKIAYKINFTEILLNERNAVYLTRNGSFIFHQDDCNVNNVYRKYLLGGLALCKQWASWHFLFLIICYLFSTQFVYLPKHRIWKCATLNYTRTKTQSSFSRFGVQVQ